MTLLHEALLGDLGSMHAHANHDSMQAVQDDAKLADAAEILCLMKKLPDVGARVMVRWDLRPVRSNNPRKRERQWFVGVVKRQRHANKPGDTTHLVYYPVDNTEAWHDAEDMHIHGHWRLVGR